MVKNQGPNGMRLFPNGKVEDTDATIVDACMRECTEETGGLTEGKIKHIMTIGDFYRKSGLIARDDEEKEQLDSITDKDQKFLLIKKQLYELFVVTQSQTLPNFTNAPRDKVIESAKW
ncbi:MAG: NUDIX domain-containing protein [Candidatus Absconditabacterales bacterium]|nr:NUDIX domain-containing protein [Candidatus Absconditabacterales bacterium]